MKYLGLPSRFSNLWICCEIGGWEEYELDCHYHRGQFSKYFNATQAASSRSRHADDVEPGDEKKVKKEKKLKKEKDKDKEKKVKKKKKENGDEEEEEEVVIEEDHGDSDYKHDPGSKRSRHCGGQVFLFCFATRFRK